VSDGSEQVLKGITHCFVVVDDHPGVAEHLSHSVINIDAAASPL
jgi:hypothetical protein